MDSQDNGTAALEQATMSRPASGMRGRLQRALDDRLRSVGPDISFSLVWPDGEVQQFGSSRPTFQVRFRNAKGVRAAATLDELRFCEAYMEGDIDIDGSMYDLFHLRGVMRDVRPLKRLTAFLYRHVLNTSRLRQKWIGHHYDEPVELFASFLDPEHLCYSHGFFESRDEPLETAMTRKLEYAIAATRLQPGMRVLDIGGGWGFVSPLRRDTAAST